MIKGIVANFSEPQLKLLLENMIAICEKECPDVVKRSVMDTYQTLFKNHFDKELLKTATDQMQNEDGTTGAKWSVEQTNSVARSNGIEFGDFNEYDWNYVMNMVYSDYYGAVENDASVYAKLAKRFLCDKDSTDGKALKYYLATNVM